MQYVEFYTIDVLKATEEEFVKYILYLRGYMNKRHQDALCNIYQHGIDRMRDVCVKKQMGTKNIEERCLRLTREEQERFCAWMDTLDWKAKKNEIDLWDQTKI